MKEQRLTRIEGTNDFSELREIRYNLPGERVGARGVEMEGRMEGERDLGRETEERRE